MPPLADGQISLFTSLVCHCWWLTPSCEPAAVTIAATASALSRA